MSASPASIFSQKLDRVAFTAYFLGAVVPLVALGVVVERFVLPMLSDRLATLGLLALVLSLVVLSLGSFLALRRTTRESLARMDRDNARLSALLNASGELGSSQHARDVVVTAARFASDLDASLEAFVIVRDEDDGSPVLAASSATDPDKPDEPVREDVLTLGRMVMEESSPVLRGAGDPSRGSSELPALALPIKGDAGALGALAVIGAHAGASLDPEVMRALESLAGLTSVALRNSELREAQRNFFSHMTDMLVSALDARLGYQTGHGSCVARMSNRLGRELGLEEQRLQNLHFAALLHDVGMLKLERDVEMGSRGCEKHSLLGSRMLGRIRVWKEVAPIVLHHHERFDGSGYPEAIAGEAIPLEARIVAVCDAWDAMTNRDSYKEPLSGHEALGELRAGSGTQFDPEVVAAMCEVVRAEGLDQTDV